MKAQFVYEILVGEVQKPVGGLNETYESFRELQSAVNVIMESLEDLKGGNPVPIKSLFKGRDLSGFPTIKNFLSSNVGVIYDDSVEDPSFAFPSEGEGFTPEEKRLRPYLNASKWPLGIVIVKSGDDIRGALIHELQHAYDYFRSKGKMRRDKKISKYQKTANQEGEEAERNYVRLDAEKSAYFIDVVNYLQNEYFQDPPYNGKLPPVKEAFKLFKMGFPRWDLLKTADRKKLANRFYVYWTKILREGEQEK